MPDMFEKKHKKPKLSKSGPYSNPYLIPVCRYRSKTEQKLLKDFTIDSLEII